MKDKRRCLYCYNPLEGEAGDFHDKCSKKFFGSAVPPAAEFGLEDIEAMAVQVLGRHESVTGVQPKLSLDTEMAGGPGRKKRFTIVGMWGNYILKPPMLKYPGMPEIEDLTMHISGLLKIKTAEHSLIRLKSGELAYISKRFDRAGHQKLQLEDMAQLTETLTERKYKSSMERIGKAVQKYSTNTKLDLLTLFELTILSFLTGNADMHLKNFSLLRTPDDEIVLSPAYDLLATKLLIPEDTEELALTLNGKKSNLKKQDFDEFAEKLGINDKARDNTYGKFFRVRQGMLEFIDKSFLTDELKEKYKDLLSERFARL
ncbi:MAG TPA: HipA domain-containing protein [Ignavibacteriales bacterium]|nr:HipA domain-containing protein [Ignavibacteriales bacterium]